MQPKISSLAQVEAQNPRPARRIRQTHPLNQIRLVAVEKAAADLILAVEEALPAKAAAVGLLMEEVQAAAVRAEVKARRAEVKAGAVAVAKVAETVVVEAKATAKAMAVAKAMAAARATETETDTDTTNEEADDWYQGPYPAAKDE